jgi:AcrR family transcriptional regulator
VTRTKGSRNKDFEQTRAALLRKVQDHLLDHPDPTLSFRALAEIVGVGVPTLSHYFGNREGLWKAVMAQFQQDGQAHIKRAFEFRPKELEASLKSFVTNLSFGWQMGLCAVHQFGLSSGLVDPELGQSYVNELLEPTVQALEKRFALHEAEGTFPSGDHRHAALCFLSPLLIALLHQDALLGKRCRPLDLKAFADEHVARFIKAWAAPQSKAA